MTWHIMVAEIFSKNRLDALLKPIVGTNHGRNALLIKSDDISPLGSMPAMRFVGPNLLFYRL